jgi:hypothetical protein
MAALKGTSESQDTSESEDASSTRTSNALAHPTGGTATSSPSCPGARVLRRRRPTAKSGGIVVSAVETASTVISLSVCPFGSDLLRNKFDVIENISLDDSCVG